MDATPHIAPVEEPPLRAPPVDNREDPTCTAWNNPNTNIPASTDPTIFEVPFDTPSANSVSALSKSTDPPIPTAPFTKTDYDDLFGHPTYLAHGTIGLGRTVRETKIITVDTAAGPNLIEESQLRPGWRSFVQTPPNLPSFQGANASGFDLLGVVPLWVTIGDLSTLVWFGVVRRLTTKILLGTSYLNRFVQRIEPLSRRLTPVRSRTIPLLVKPEDRNPAVSSIVEPELLTTHAAAFRTPQRERSCSIKLARAVCIPARTQQWVPVTSQHSGLITVVPHPRTSVHQTVVAANGVAQVWENERFYILIANWGDYPASFPKHMRVAQASNPPTIFSAEKGSGEPHSEMAEDGESIPAEQTTTTPQEKPKNRRERRQRVRFD